jgi:DNA-binding transcriptional LysR family regulator
MNETTKAPYLFLLKAPLFEINNKQYSLTDAGEKMISEVDGMLESGNKITQEIAFRTLQNYFHIQ